MGVSLQLTTKILPQEQQQPQPLHPPCGSLCPGFFQILSPSECFPSPLRMVPGYPKDWLGRAAIFPLPFICKSWSEQPFLHQDGKVWDIGFSALAGHWAARCTSRGFLFPIKSQFLYNLSQATCTVQIFIA